jgi:solute carrier family 35 (GDP-fucose transporter), member C1
VGMVTFNNLCLKHVEVSFYNVARSLTIVFNVVFSYLILGTSVSFRTLLCLLVVFVGFWIGSDGEINFSLIGTVAGVVSSLFVSLNSIYTKKVLPVVNDNQWLLTYVNNANATLLFLPLVLVMEGDIIVEHIHQIFFPIFWMGMALSGVLGFAIGIVTVMQIKATSPLTHNISGTSKAAVQSVMAFYIWGNEATTKSILGIASVLLGSSFYTYVAMKENEKRRAMLPTAKAGVSAGSQ